MKKSEIVLESNTIQELFTEYEKAFAALDIEKNAGFSPIHLSQPARGALLRRARPSF